MLNIAQDGSDLRATAPAFDPLRHSALNRELKGLYVGLTRARQNCWFFDIQENPPLIAALESREFIKIYPQDVPVPRLAKQDTPEAWRDAAADLLALGLYDRAANAFRKGKLEYMAQQAQAQSLWLGLEQVLPSDNSDEATSRFAKVGDLFLSVAAQFEDGRHSASDMKYAFINRADALKKAAECFDRAHLSFEAGKAYETLGEWDNALARFWSAKQRDSAVRILTTKYQQLKKGPADRLRNTIRLEYIKNSDYNLARQLFESTDDMVTFLRRNGLVYETIPLYEALGEFGKVAEIHLEQGSYAEAAAAFLNAKAYDDALSCMLTQLWHTLPISFGVAPQHVHELLQRSQAVRLQAPSRSLHSREVSCKVRPELHQAANNLQPDRSPGSSCSRRYEVDTAIQLQRTGYFDWEAR